MRPAQLLADAGFRCEEVFAQLKEGPPSWRGAGARKAQLAIDVPTYPHTAAMAAKLKSDAGKAAYRQRKWLSEAPNGWIKNLLGFRQFSLRGLGKVAAEWKLICLALNLRRTSTMCAA